MIYEYKVVRTWDDGKCTEFLEKAFKEGYEFVRASEYVPSETHGGIRRYGYIEYILRRSDGRSE